MSDTTLPIEPQSESPASAHDSLVARFDQFKAATADKPAEAEDAPKPEAPATDKPEEGTEPPAGKEKAPPSEVERSKYKELKSKADERDELVGTRVPAMEKELAELREKAAKVVDTSVYDKQIQEKQKALDDYEKKLALYDIRESAPFKNEVIAPLNRIGQKLGHLANSYKISPQALNDALLITDPAQQRQRIEELTADFSPVHQAQVWDQVEKAQEIYGKAAEMEANAEATKKEVEFMSAQERKKADEEAAKVQEVARTEVHKQFLTHLPWIKDDEALSKALLSAKVDTDPTMASYNTMSGVLVAAMTVQQRKDQARIAELEGKLAARSALAPKGGGGGGGNQSPQTTPVYVEGESAWDRAKKMGVAHVGR